MKKSIAICVLGMALALANVYAEHPKSFGIGVQGGWSGGMDGGLTLHFPSMPAFWTVDIDDGGFGVAGDFYFIDKTISKKINLGWYLGIGAYAYLGLWRDDLNISGALRLPIGLSWQPAKFFELYLQAVPSLGLHFVPDIGMWPNYLGGNIGIRFWL
jgi:hypothetical protein